MWSSGLYGYLSDYLLWWLMATSIIVHTFCFFRFTRNKRRPNARLIVGNGLMFCSLLGVTGLMGETYFRFLCVETDSFGVSMPAQKWFALYVRLNSLGCRDKEWTHEKPHNVYRIAFVGDSFTYGWGVENPEDRFTDRLQSWLNSQGASNSQGSNGADINRPHVLGVDGTKDSGITITNPYRARQEAADREVDTGAVHLPRFDTTSQTIEIMNVAMPGWGTGDQFRPIKNMIDTYGADEIILAYVPNDIEKLIPRKPEFDPLLPPSMTLFNPTTSALMDYLFHRLVVPRVPTVANYHDWLAEGFESDTIWRQHQQQFFAIAQICKDRNVRFRVVLLPFIKTGGEKYKSDNLHAKLYAFLQANQIEVLDMLPILTSHQPADLVVSPSDAHPNDRAHRWFAEQLHQFFESP